MSKMVQVRNVPDELHRSIKARAAMEGISLSEYVLRLMRIDAERPTRREILERIERRSPVRLSVPPADLIRADRDAR